MTHPNMNNATRLCLIRHGETTWNAERRIQGQLDIQLSEVGLAQAEALAASLADTRIDAIYSSDLARARQTAEACLRRLDRPLHLRTGLRERHYGVFQGLTYAEAAERHPQAYASFAARDAEFALSGGESLAGFTSRVLQCVHAILDEHAGGTLLAFTHGGVLDVLYRHATGKPLDAPRDFDIPNTGLNWFEVSGGRWRIRRWADRSHLTDVLDEFPG